MTVIQHCWWQILVAAIAYFALGALWFNPKTFGTAWANSHGVKMDPEKRKEVNMGKLFGLSFLCGLLISAVIAWVIYATCCGDSACMNHGMMHCVKIGFMIGAAVAAGLAMNHLYLMKPAAAFYIDGGYHIVGGMLMAAILHLTCCC